VIFRYVKTWDAVLQAGWIDVYKSVPEFIKNMYKNAMSIMWHIEISANYWENEFPEDYYADHPELVLNPVIFRYVKTDFSKSIIDFGADLGEYCWLTNFSHAYAFEPNKESAFALCANALLWERV
jgi:hypothetical protein